MAVEVSQVRSWTAGSTERSSAAWRRAMVSGGLRGTGCGPGSAAIGRSGQRRCTGSECPLVRRIRIGNIQKVGAGHRVGAAEFDRGIADSRPSVGDTFALIDNDLFHGAERPHQELDITAHVVRVQVRRHAAEVVAERFGAERVGDVPVVPIRVADKTGTLSVRSIRRLAQRRAAGRQRLRKRRIRIVHEDMQSNRSAQC